MGRYAVGSGTFLEMGIQRIRERPCSHILPLLELSLGSELVDLASKLVARLSITTTARAESV